MTYTIDSIADALSRSPAVVATIGLDGAPQARPAAYRFTQDGALYFDCLKSERLYAELCRVPALQLCISAGSETIRVSGEAHFTQDGAILDRCMALRPDRDRNSVIAFFLTGVSAELPEGPIRLPDPGGVLIGVTIRKKTELRDRIARILERREEQGVTLTGDEQRLLDGALFVFAEAAKKLWPRMDIRPIERAAVFETYDERERWTNEAAALIGNAQIDKPEDLTYWLSIDTLRALNEQRNGGTT
ncbi:MAG: hypothetical protein E7423_05185 [Ruminococcaceae bacterium]|nr:hypothetical protein [Oscillospiraceae bacterium]